MPRYLPTAVALLVALLASASSSAEAPPLVPLQGVLHQSDGEPVDGTLSIRFALYAREADAEPVWAETQAVRFDQGLFTVALGANVPLPLELFDELGSAWVGIRVDTDSEMPRVPLGTVPWAAWAEFSGDARTLQGASLDDIAANALVDGDARWAPREHTTPWSTITDVPPALADGDSDTLSEVLCSAGQILRFGALGWQCADELDSFDTFVCGEGQIARWTAGTWTCSEDRDTDTDTNTDLLASITRCSAGQVLKWTGAAWDCADDINTDTNTDVLAALACVPGQIPRWSGAAWVCANDVDTDTDTRCDVAGACSQLCIGATCTNRFRGIPHVVSISGSFASGGTYVVPAVAGVATELTVALRTYGGGNCEGGVSVRWRNAGGAVLRDYTAISGTNVGNGNDGGSGMGDRELATIPLLEGTAFVDFAQTGCHGFGGDYIALTWFE